MYYVCQINIYSINIILINFILIRPGVFPPYTCVCGYNFRKKKNISNSHCVHNRHTVLSVSNTHTRHDHTHTFFVRGGGALITPHKFLAEVALYPFSLTDHKYFILPLLQIPCPHTHARTHAHTHTHTHTHTRTHTHTGSLSILDQGSLAQSTWGSGRPVWTLWK